MPEIQILDDTAITGAGKCVHEFQIPDITGIQERYQYCF